MNKTLSLVGTGAMFLCIGALFAFAGCPQPLPTPAPPDSTVDAPAPPVDDAAPAGTDASPVPEAAPPVAEAAPPAAEAAPKPSTPCETACAQLATLGCTEGKAADCVATCTQLVNSHLTPFDPACCYNAKTVAAERKCPRITCK
jgi:hypothetical protein